MFQNLKKVAEIRSVDSSMCHWGQDWVYIIWDSIRIIPPSKNKDYLAYDSCICLPETNRHAQTINKYKQTRNKYFQT